MGGVVAGMELILKNPPSWLAKKARVGLLCNSASVDRRLRLSVERMVGEFPGALKVLLSPQHGFWAEKQDNMILSSHEISTRWGVPLYSLYGETLRPTGEMLSQLDVLVVDLQEVGCRVYTYIYTMLGCMEECARWGVKLVVADRPNPIGGEEVEGNILKPQMKSLVGAHPLPMRHGLTMGELALLFKGSMKLDLDLEVWPVQGWRRDLYFDQTQLPWVMPSPNLPTLDSCLVYPGQVLLEGTNLSEGRGTTRPFEIFGAPFIDPFLLEEKLHKVGIPGVLLRPLYFEPTHGKWKGERCGGLQLHVVERASYRPYITTLWILHEVLMEWGEHLEWRPPPYEFEEERWPIDLLLGDPEVRSALERGSTPEEIQSSWMGELEEWMERREEYLLYRG
jgi:uncharacterized protein YbbC (DUF1343 family)